MEDYAWLAALRSLQATHRSLASKLALPQAGSGQVHMPSSFHFTVIALPSTWRWWSALITASPPALASIPTIAHRPPSLRLAPTYRVEWEGSTLIVTIAPRSPTMSLTQSSVAEGGRSPRNNVPPGVARQNLGGEWRTASHLAG